jgi:hypothetical protein
MTTLQAGFRSQSQSLTVMSKGRGSPYTQQSYKICDGFPYYLVVEKVCCLPCFLEQA